MKVDIALRRQIGIFTTRSVNISFEGSDSDWEKFEQLLSDMDFKTIFWRVNL